MGTPRRGAAREGLLEDALRTAGRASEILNLDVDDLDLANKQATIISKGGARATVHWQSGTARLLPKYLKDRTRGPLFLTNIKPGPSHTPAAGDLCPDTGRARLSYARAETIFKQTSSGNTLHQLRHSSLTAWAENGVDVPMLMARSRHRSYRSLQRYLAVEMQGILQDATFMQRTSERWTSQAIPAAIVLWTADDRAAVMRSGA